MEITINLPEKVLANLSTLAGKSQRRLDQVILEKLEHALTVEVEDLEKQLAHCSDQEVLDVARIQMPAKQDDQLSKLLHKQEAEKLTAAEQKALWKLMELNRRTTLKKAFALREISRRGLNDQN